MPRCCSIRGCAKGAAWSARVGRACCRREMEAEAFESVAEAGLCRRWRRRWRRRGLTDADGFLGVGELGSDVGRRSRAGKMRVGLGLQGGGELGAGVIAVAELRADHPEGDEDLRACRGRTPPTLALLESVTELALGLAERRGRIIVAHHLLDGRQHGDVIGPCLRRSNTREHAREHHDGCACSPNDHEGLH